MNCYFKTYYKKYRNTKIGRASHLIGSYHQIDLKCGRGQGTLTKEELIQLWENGCYYCGEKDWHKLGADRIDNSKPHSLENCVCSCWKCNFKKEFLRKSKKIQQYTIDNEFVKEYISIQEAARQINGNASLICACCNGKRKSHKGYIWKYLDGAVPN